MPALLFPVVAVETSTETAPRALTHQYSGVVINQNHPPESNTDFVVPDASYYYQTFLLPANYERVGEFIPTLTGFQVYVGVTPGSAPTATFNWTFDHYIVGVGWTREARGTTTGTALDGNELWHTIYFDQPVDVDSTALTDRFRIGVQASGGVSRLWYTVPNPLAATFDKLFKGDMNTAVQDSSRDVSLMFRTLADVADDGTDFLGNSYRSGVVRNGIGAIDTGPGNDRDQFWLSAPQPSRFAVVNQYFDMRQDEQAVVLDGLLVDPTTPGVYFHVYYSNDESPGTDPDSWDQLLWTPIPQAFQLTTRTHFAFPKPITTKYIKIEYSHLQPKHYAPGDFQKPVIYKKHPQWVTDYFLARVLSRNTEDPLIARRVEVIYDALDFAYNYYSDDLTQSPDKPTTNQAITVLKKEDESFSVDPTTLSKIRIAFQPFLNQPALLGRGDYLLGDFLTQSAATNYPTEAIDRSRANTEEVLSLEREPVIVEKSFPVMFFYVVCRHSYRVSMAKFDQDRGYFAGVNEIAFTRQRYTAVTDSDLYIESTGDLVNVQRSDFENIDFKWVTWRDS